MHTYTHTSRKREREREKGLLLDHMVIFKQEAKVLLNVKMWPKQRHKGKDRAERMERQTGRGKI